MLQDLGYHWIDVEDSDLMRCLQHTILPIRLSTPMHVKRTIMYVQRVFLRMNPRGSKHVGDIRN